MADGVTGKSVSATEPPDDILQVSDTLLQACLDKLAVNLGQFQPVDEIFIGSCHQVGLDTGNGCWNRLTGLILNMVAQGYLKVSLGGENP